MNTETITDITMNLNDPRWIMEHLSIALQRTSEDHLVKRPCDLDGIEQYLILTGEKDDSLFTVKVVPLMLSNVGIDENLAWNRALENLCDDTQIKSLGKVLADIAGIPFDSAAGSDMKFHVITNSHKCKGAACIMDRKALRILTQSYDTNMLVVLPSSVHAMMITPYDSSIDLDELSAIVKEINETQVAPKERLTDRAYILSL